MEKRRLGRTGQMSSVAILGGAAFWDESQDSADAAIQLALDHGVNHIDVAPQYGKAEELIGPWIKTHRDKFFLGCKTLERQADAARAEMEVSLKKLNTDSFDLYQFHAVTSSFRIEQGNRQRRRVGSRHPSQRRRPHKAYWHHRAWL